jgi:hypothetical protein
MKKLAFLDIFYQKKRYFSFNILSNYLPPNKKRQKKLLFM